MNTSEDTHHRGNFTVWLVYNVTGLDSVPLIHTNKLGSTNQWYYLITCKISRSIDLRYGMKNKISLLMLENIWALVEFHYLTVPFPIFWVFLRKFQKTPKKTETIRYLYFTEVRQFQSIGRISLPYHFGFLEVEMKQLDGWCLILPLTKGVLTG